MSTDDSRGEKLAALNDYRANRAGRYVQWLAWAVGIARRWAELRVDDEGARLGAAALISVIRKTSNEIFRAVLTDDVAERLTAQGALSGSQRVGNLVTRLLSKKDEVTPEDLAELGLEDMDFLARDRFCDAVNSVLFRPDVGLSPELRISLQRDMIKALEAIGDTEQFKDALNEAARTGRYAALAELLDRQDVVDLEVDVDAPSPEMVAEPSDDEEAEHHAAGDGGDVLELHVVHAGPPGRAGSDDDPGPLAA